MDHAISGEHQDAASIAAYWSRKVVHLLCFSNSTLVKNHQIDSKYRELVKQFNLNTQPFFKLNNKKTSFLHSLWQKIKFVQPVFAGDCSGQWHCALEDRYHACNNFASDPCNPNAQTPCDDGSSCDEHITCSLSIIESHPCTDADNLDACYERTCPTFYCNPPDLNLCHWDEDLPPPPPPACGDGWCDVEGDEGCGNCEVDCGTCPGDPNCDCCYWGGVWNDGGWCATADQRWTALRGIEPQDQNAGLALASCGRSLTEPLMAVQCFPSVIPSQGHAQRAEHASEESPGSVSKSSADVVDSSRARR